MSTNVDSTDAPILGVAIIGMAGRFPGAEDVDAFWKNLCDGVESIRRFDDEELTRLGVPPESIASPNFIKAGAILDGIKEFDAAFFGYSPREAELIDPQHRIFLECAWQAFENAGCVPERVKGAVGVFGGCGAPSYLLCNLMPHADLSSAGNLLSLLNGNDKDSFTTRVAYKLNLRGPALTVQTACSTSLVAVHMACQALLTYQCDLALAGGSSAFVPQRTGYFYERGQISSSDGHCRAFDARADGTVFGSGAGAVLLKRLEDAIADGDPIVAVIRGSAINNDGSQKAGFTAPSIEGQAEAISMAHAAAGVDASSISYVEAHGTGTSLGDPVEVAALTRAFRSTTDGVQFCALGSVKTNLGHLDSASGVVGLIKTAMALKNGTLPASLHFEAENPQIGFASTPFYVNDRLRKWDTKGAPRRAGVSSFGIGGTNAHVVVEQAPERPSPAASSVMRAPALLPLSARTGSALAAVATRLADFLERTDVGLADVAHTLQTGRRAFEQRAFVVCSDRDEAVRALRDCAAAPRQTFAPKRSVVFAFPGQGTQHAGMAADLYDREPTFRAHVDTGARAMERLTGVDPRPITFGRGGASPALLEETSFAQPALFVIEVALARYWMERWGVQPSAVLGHSVGEYAAACVAGVFSFEDAIAILVERGRLMQSTPEGAMLAVSAEVALVEPELGSGLALAAVNGPSQCVVAGELHAIERLEARFAARHVTTRRMATRRAFHSHLMDPIVDAFVAHVARFTLHAPAVPLLSNVTGQVMRDAEATSPAFWGTQLRRTVRFADNLKNALRERHSILLEVGPGQTLTRIARASFEKPSERATVASLPARGSAAPALAHAVAAAGELWAAGVDLTWKRADEAGEGRPVALPTYPFERATFWIDPPAQRGPRVTSPRSVKNVELAEEDVEEAPMSRHALHARPALATPYVAPRTPTETTLVTIWGALLGIDRVGVDDNFFDLGGDSLIAVRVAARVREELGVDFDLRSLFASPTAAMVAEMIVPPSSLGLSALIAELEGLSDEEVEARLAEKKKSA